MAESVSKQLLSAVTEGHTKRNSLSTSHSSRRTKRHLTTPESTDNNRDRSRSRIRTSKSNQTNLSNETQQSSTASSKRSSSTTQSSGYKSEDSEAINSIASRTRSHSQRKSFDQNSSTVTSFDKRYRSESDTSELRQTDTEDTEYTPNKQSAQRRKREANTSRKSATKKSPATPNSTATEQKAATGERRRKLRSESAAHTSTISGNNSEQESSSSSGIPKKRFRQSDPDTLNLGARLAKSGSGREPQQRISTQETHTTGQPPSLLRRSSRSKGNLYMTDIALREAGSKRSLENGIDRRHKLI